MGLACKPRGVLLLMHCIFTAGTRLLYLSVAYVGACQVLDDQADLNAAVTNTFVT
jgi:hypothetical protein